MKISKVSVLEFSRELDGTAWNPAFRWRERRAPLVLVELDDGVVGIGEGWSKYTDCESVLTMLADKVGPALIGKTFGSASEAYAYLCTSFSALEPAWARAAAISAVDIALWDAAAKGEGIPLWKMLGGTDASAPVYASGGLYRDGQDSDALKSEFQRYVDSGFISFKMKIAGIPLAADMERVGAVRTAIGDEARLWIDGVNQLTSDSAGQWFAALDRFNPEAIQSPVAFDDVVLMQRINREFLPVIAAEAEYRHDAFLRLVDAKAISHMQYCLPLCGGVTGALALDEMAARAGVSSTPQCFSTSVAQAATLHFAAARANVVSAEYHCFHDHLAFLYQDGAGTVSEGTACAGRGPGLGVMLPEIGTQPDGSKVSIVRELR
ncbi:Mandelate racemase/muconate lactonizing enzyme family protein [Paraburkholderia piptadeniae]|uniref:Mandelate racemase/muconate lactonizing enzyme family protein n=1 Tax=Paraburkholderia piptadeniae TaxID=1701573 RepID=A0A1N7RWI8_9BURK|nr:mandelate racemase/muconate lactonizing enzyme family protein [Paraburkholderia piptadeniae]SIT39461.1 Mandelate racemase/muconate lactonizing enzyme family protein [Paraburkholderia piptadeniae]